MKSFLFAYGTLQPRNAPAELRATLKYLRPVASASVKGKLYDLGEFPAAVFGANSNEEIRGTVYRLPENPIDCDKLLLKLDQYEGVDRTDPCKGLFVRRRLPVTLRNGRKLDCWVFEYAGELASAAPVFDGVYVGPRKNRRASPKRFRSIQKVAK